MITVSILLILHMYIRPAKLLENGAPNAKFDADRIAHLRFNSLDWNNSNKIEEAIAMVKDDKDKEIGSLEKV